MILKRSIFLLLSLLLSSCVFDGSQGTIAELETIQIDLKDTDVEGGLEKAMQGYQKFLAETPESQLTPEAIRRLADLKVEKEYGIVTDETALEGDEDSSSKMPVPELSTQAVSTIDVPGKTEKSGAKSDKLLPVAGKKESESDFEKRAVESKKIKSAAGNKQFQLPKGEAAADLQNAGAEEAISLYNKLLKKYPMYERNDQVLYQLSRAYEEIGQVDEAMTVMNRLVKQFPNSRYNDEVHFRRGEYYFTRKKYLDAEDAYGEVLKMGVGSVYYERALYKKGWTFYKQELYEEAINQYIELLDHKASIGYDFEQTENKIEKKRVDDTFHVVSLSFSNLGGASTVQDYFDRHGSRAYEYGVYRNLAEFYFVKRRYSDAAATYDAFVERNPFHKVSPHFSMRVIDIYLKGGFPKLVIKGKKQFAHTYGLTAEYWNYFNNEEYPQVIGYLKSNIFDLANHYHSLYQNKKYQAKRHKEKKAGYFGEAVHWYREYLKSFPKDKQSPKINYQFADLLLENRDFELAAIEYERAAYDYPLNDNSHKAAYAAVYSYREFLKIAPGVKVGTTKRNIVRSSLRLVDEYPSHEKATVILGAAVDDLFGMRDFILAIKTGRRLIKEYPDAKPKIRRGAWLVVAHSSFDLKLYSDAEIAYIEVLQLTDAKDKSRVKLVDNLAASIYKQGELARDKGEFKVAVQHFLRIAKVAPASKIRQTAEYDAAAVLLQIKDLEQAATVLLAFRDNFPGHELQKDVTKKIAFVYKELGRYALAAVEFEKIAAESEQDELIRDALLIAADMYEKAKDTDNALRLHEQFVVRFPQPVEFALEIYNKIALIYKNRKNLVVYHQTLRKIINIDGAAGEGRTERTRYLAASASLILIEPDFVKFTDIKLVNPLKRSINKKKKSMKALIGRFAKLVDYGVADVTAASTYYLAEIYYNFSRSLMESERPKKLSELELEEFVFALEEQAYPFEEKTITVHEKNVELLGIGVYSQWIDRSIEKLAKLIPARYAKSEESSGFIASLNSYTYLPANAEIMLAKLQQIKREAELAKKAAAAALLKSASKTPLPESNVVDIDEKVIVTEVEKNSPVTVDQEEIIADEIDTPAKVEINSNEQESTALENQQVVQEPQIESEKVNSTSILTPVGAVNNTPSSDPDESIPEEADASAKVESNSKEQEPTAPENQQAVQGPQKEAEKEDNTGIPSPVDAVNNESSPKLESAAGDDSIMTKEVEPNSHMTPKQAEEDQVDSKAFKEIKVEPVLKQTNNQEADSNNVYQKLEQTEAVKAVNKPESTPAEPSDAVSTNTGNSTIADE